MPLDEMSEVVDIDGQAPPVAVSPHTVPIRHSLYVYYLDIAKREKSSVAAVINDTLMKARGEA